MGVDKRSGDKFITKRPTGADVPFTDQSPDVASNANIAQLAADLYTAPSLDNDGLPNLVSPFQTTIPPVGSIIPHYDFGGVVAITGAWKYCDGSAIADAASPINGQLLPDLSNRYLVGFGTEAGGDIDSAVWATPAVGNASHLINIQHNHDVNISSFSSGSTTASHSHTLSSAGWVQANMDTVSNEIQVRFTTISAWTANFSGLMGGGIASSATGESVTSGWTLDGSTDSGGASHSHTVDPPNTATTNNGSTALDAQPRSIRVRFIMRIK